MEIKGYGGHNNQIDNLINWLLLFEYPLWSFHGDRAVNPEFMVAPVMIERNTVA